MKLARLSWANGRWFRVIASTLLLIICLNFVDSTALLRALSGVHIGYFLAAFGLNAIGTVLVRAWVAHLTTRASGLLLSYGELVRINLVARFYTIVLPRGASAAIRWQRYREGGSGHAAAALLIFENLVSIFTLFVSAAVILLIEQQYTGAMGRVLLYISWAGALLTAMMLMPFASKRCAEIFKRIFHPIIRSPGRLSDLAGRMYSAVADYQSISLRQMMTILAASLIGYIFFVLSAWVLALGMSLDISLAAIAWVRSVTLLLALVPITVAGIGLREGAFIVLLNEYGVSTSTAFAYALTSFAIQLFIGLLGAVIELTSTLRRGRLSKDNESGGI